MTKLTFIGTAAGGFKGSARLKSCVYLDGLLLDCGAGVSGRLEELGLLESIDAIFVSHLHSDHVSGLYDALVSMVIIGRSRPLKLFSPPGLRSLVQHYEDLGNKLHDPSNGFELDFVDSSDFKYSGNSFRVSPFQLDHVVTDWGYRLEKEGICIFYTGDTREPSALLNQKVDYLLHEATFDESYRQLSRLHGHSTALEAAKAAETTGARRLFLVHVENRTSPPEAKLREAESAFSNVVLPEDLESFDL